MSIPCPSGHFSPRERKKHFHSACPEEDATLLALQRIAGPEVGKIPFAYALILKRFPPYQVRQRAKVILSVSLPSVADAAIAICIAKLQMCPDCSSYSSHYQLLLSYKRVALCSAQNCAEPWWGSLWRLCSSGVLSPLTRPICAEPWWGKRSGIATNRSDIPFTPPNRGAPVPFPAACAGAVVFSPPDNGG